MQPSSQILPVIDLKRGQVVHAVGGGRHNYQPIISELSDSPHPGKVAKSLRRQTHAADIYIADLDAIVGQESDWNSYSAIANQDLKLWLDAGTGCVDSIAHVLDRVADLKRVIVSLESLRVLRDLEELFLRLPADRLAFSLDLRNELPITKDPAASKLSAETIASFAHDCGVRSMIVLDIASVGMPGRISTVDLCRRIKSRFLDLELVSGGGVRDLKDVDRFRNAGCDRVLVATALH